MIKTQIDNEILRFHDNLSEPNFGGGYCGVTVFSV